VFESSAPASPEPQGESPLQRMAATEGPATYRTATAVDSAAAAAVQEAPTTMKATSSLPSGTEELACFAVPAAITEQMTQEVKSKARSQLPEGVAFEDHYPELVLSYASGRRAEDCEGAGPGMIYAAGLLGILHELRLASAG